MKHIGIVDITTVGACLCMNEIVAQAAKIVPSGKHPEITMHSFSFDQYKELIHRQDWIQLGKKICQSIEKLQKVEADFIIIPSNTPHYAFNIINQNSKLPVVNLIEVVVNQCHQKGFSKVLILGTKLTMKGDLYTTLMNQRNINTIIPSDSDCDQIDNFIQVELIPSQINSNSVQSMCSMIRQYDCDGIILGCTELPMVFNQNNLGKPVIDTTRLLAHYALELAMKN